MGVAFFYLQINDVDLDLLICIFLDEEEIKMPL